MKLSEKFAVGAVAAVLIKFVFSGITLAIGAKTINFGALDGGTVASILTPVLGAHHLGSYIETMKGNTKNDNQT